MSRLLLLGSLMAAPASGSPPYFHEAAAESGLVFHHFNGSTGHKYISETVGSGVAVFDYDGDGDLDVYAVQGGMLDGESVEHALEAPRLPGPLSGRLFRNELGLDASGRFVASFRDVTAEAGLSVATGYGMGAATGDVDNDGDVDLYLTFLGESRLMRNRGDGTFERAEEVTVRGWSVPASFFDFDADGDLDLFVGTYLGFSLALHKTCVAETGLEDYCGPLTYRSSGDRLFRNAGGLFEDISAPSGVGVPASYALGSIAADLDSDGKLDLYVANDQTPNFLWHNRGGGTFEEVALLAGCAVDADGKPQASMGVDAADVDGDSDEDLLMTNLSREGSALFVNDGSALFRDASTTSGLATASWPLTGFGAAFVDFDNDGWLDVLSVNGAVYVIPEQAKRGELQPLRQPKQLLRNAGMGRFEDVTANAGEAFTHASVGRGAAFGDVDNDGDLDVVASNNGGPLELLINELGSRGPWLGLVLGSHGRDALGARVEVRRTAGPSLVRRCRTDGSFASARDPRVLAGLGASALGGVEIRWLEGRRRQLLGLRAGGYAVVREELP